MRRNLRTTLFSVMSWTLTIATLSLSAAALRIASGPIGLGSLAPAAAEAVDEALAEAAPGWTAGLEDLELRRDPGDDGFGLRLIGVSLRDPGGETVVNAPEIALAINPLAALSGRLEISAITMQGGSALIRRDAQGGWSLAMRDPAGAAGAPIVIEADAAATNTAAADAAALGEAETGSVRPEAGAPGAEASPAQGRAVAEAADDPQAVWTRLLDAWSDAEGDSGPIASLRRVTVSDAQLRYEDAFAGARWGADAARFDLSRPAGGGLAVAVRAEVDFGEGDAPTPIALSAERLRGAETARLAARFERAPVSAAARPFPPLASLTAARGYVSGEAEATLSIADGGLLSLSARLRGEGAAFPADRAATPPRGQSAALGEAIAPAATMGAAVTTSLEAEPAPASAAAQTEDPLARSAFVAQFDYAPEEDRLRLERLEILGDRMTAALSGAARLRRGPERAIIGAEGHLAIEEGRVHDPALFEAPLAILGGGFDFTFDAETETDGAPILALEALSVKTPDVSALGAARILFKAPTQLGAADTVGGLIGARADLELALSTFEASRLAALWPLPAAPGGRAWVAANLVGGQVEDGRLVARIGGGTRTPRPPAPGEAAPAPVETIDLSFRFSDLESRYLGAMTPVTGGVGSGRIDAKRFDLEVDEGVVDLGEDGVLSIAGSRFAIPDFGPYIPPSEIEIRSAGPIRALLALIDQEPLALPRKLGVDPATVEGAHEGITRLALPLAKELPLEAISIDAAGELSNLAMPVSQLGGDVARAEAATIEVDAAGLRLRGDARLEGYERHNVWVDWRETFAPEPGAPRTRMLFATTLTADELYDLGAPPEIGVEGSARVNAWLEARDEAPVRLRLRGMLANLGVADPFLGWTKPVGEEAELSASAVFAEGGWRVDQIEATGPGLAAIGAARLEEAGALRSLSLSSLVVEDRIDASVEATRSEDGALSVKARGRRFDLSGVVAPQEASGEEGGGAFGEGAAATAESGSEETTRLALDLDFREVTIGEGARLQDVRLAASRAENGRLYADLTAAAGRGVLSASVRPIGESARRRYRLETDDLGQLLQASAQINAAERGSAVIEAKERKDGSVSGALTASGLVVKDAPVLADILSIASVIGIFDLATTGGISFTQIEAPFVYREGRLTLEELAATGPSMGMTLSGVIDLHKDELDLDGTVTPAFVINGLPGQMPIIGDLLTGGEGQGVIGVSFSLSGSLDAPKVSVDPLSALMPGPLRRLRRMLGG